MHRGWTAIGVNSSRNLRGGAPPFAHTWPTLRPDLRRRDGSSYQAVAPAQWGNSGGPLAVKDGEISVRTGNSQFQPRLGRGSAPGVFTTAGRASWADLRRTR